jgi:hypothetical protein
MLLALERQTLAQWNADDSIDGAVANRADRDLATEEADLAVSASGG